MASNAGMPGYRDISYLYFYYNSTFYLYHDKNYNLFMLKNHFYVQCIFV